MRNRLFNESRKRSCQEIEELRRICYEETDRARQARIDELSSHQERDPPTVSQLLTQIQDLQNKVSSLSDAREFHDLETHVPCQPSTIPSPRTMPCRDSGLPHDTRNILCTSGNVFESLPARKGPPSALFENSRNLASSSRGLRPDTTGNTKRLERELIRKPQNSSILVPRFPKGPGHFDHTGGMIDYPRFPEMHVGKFPDSMEFQSWKVNFASDYRRRNFSDCDMLDAMIASTLTRLLDKHIHFRRRVSVEEQLDQKYDRFQRGRQIAYMIYEHFCATGACEAVQGLSDLFNIRLQSDDVQVFDVRWDQALLPASGTPTEMILEGLYKSKLLDSVQLQTVSALYDQETVRNGGHPSYSPTHNVSRPPTCSHEIINPSRSRMASS